MPAPHGVARCPMRSTCENVSANSGDPPSSQTGSSEIPNLKRSDGQDTAQVKRDFGGRIGRPGRERRNEGVRIPHRSIGSTGE